VTAVSDSSPLAARAALPDRSARLATMMTAARAGDEAALGRIVSELSPMLWQVARAAGLAASDAEDVLQTVWLRLVSHLHEIRDTSALIAWLVITTRREAWHVRAAGRRQLPAEQDWFSARPDHTPGAEDQVIVDDQHRALWTAVAQLSPRCQELLRIVAFVPRPDYQAVAAKLGMPVGSVGPTRGRCLAKLRVLMDGAAENGDQERRPR
jgi:RNA polymerase sigma factor (sigma-70 family)